MKNQTQKCSQDYDFDSHWYYDNIATFWIVICIIIFIALVAAVGNAFVIHVFVTKRGLGAQFRYLNRVVLSLAIAEFTLSLFGTPFSIVYWYWGKYKQCFMRVNRNHVYYQYVT